MSTRLFLKPIYGDHNKKNPKHIFQKIKANLKVFENSVYYKGAKEWNDLPINVRKSASYESFKASQKKWLMGTIRKPE